MDPPRIPALTLVAEAEGLQFLIYILNRVLGTQADLEFSVWLKLFLNSDPPVSTS